VSGRACEACLRRNALIGLLAARIEGLLGDRRRAGALLTLDEGDLLAALGADPDTGAGAEPPGDLAARADDAGLTGICRHDPGFPRRLHDLLDPPPLLWLRGREELLHGPAVAIVGTRRASDYGLELASALGRGLGAAGVTVVSGLALGIDAPQEYPVVTVDFPPGAIVVAYTDGLVEARRGGEQFGLGRLDALLAASRGLPPQEIAEAALAACREWTEGELTDDLAVVVIKRAAAG